MRFLWIAAGLVALLVGIIGIFLPVLPTTPLVLLAAFFFGKGSPRLHGWLSGHSVFGPIITDWEARGVISTNIRRIAYSMMAVGFAASIWKGLHPGVLLVQAMGIGWAVWYIRGKPKG